LQAASDDFKRTWETESREESRVRSKLARPRAAEALQEGLAPESVSQES